MQERIRGKRRLEGGGGGGGWQHQQEMQVGGGGKRGNMICRQKCAPHVSNVKILYSFQTADTRADIFYPLDFQNF